MTEVVVPSVPADLDPDAIRTRIDEALAHFLDGRLCAIGQDGTIGELAQCVRDFVAGGGKRLRPVLSILGWQAAGGDGEVPEPVVLAAASLELFHAFALIHDDVMDDSDLRRGRPTVHRAMAVRHAAAGPSTAGRLGNGAAILAGDLALTWSDELLNSAGLPPAQLSSVLKLIATMRTEIVYGQYLDLTSAAREGENAAAALTVARYKTAKYTFERPLHLGAVLSQAPVGLLQTLTAYALPAGESFQLRDDLLGVFGDPATTGKPVLDDLRQGKPTVLLALARERATPEQATRLSGLVGRPDIDQAAAEQVRRILLQTGAVDTVESMIKERYRQAVSALRQPTIAPAARTALAALAKTAAWRNA